MMTAKRNYLEAVNGHTLAAAAIDLAGCTTIVVVPPAAGGPATELAVIRLPRAAAAKGEITIIQRCDAFAYIVMPEPGETINGRLDYVKPGGGGTRLVPLVSGDGASDGWGTV